MDAEISRIKREYWEQFSNDMKRDLYGGQRKVWNMLRNRRKPINDYIQISKITKKEWETYFKKLYTNTNDKDEGNQTAERTEEGEWLVTREMLTKTVTKLKNRKSPGVDNITNEMIKYGGSALMDELLRFYNMILTQKQVPEQWRESITIPIFKRGEKIDPRNYRGISLLSTVSKLLTKVLAEEVATTGIREEQQGFRPNRSAVDAIFILRQLAEKAIEFNKPAFMYFVDLTQAFDRVRLRDVIALLKKRHIDPNIIATIEELNTNNIYITNQTYILR